MGKEQSGPLTECYSVVSVPVVLFYEKKKNSDQLQTAKSGSFPNSQDILKVVNPNLVGLFRGSFCSGGKLAPV